MNSSDSVVARLWVVAAWGAADRWSCPLAPASAVFKEVTAAAGSRHTLAWRAAGVYPKFGVYEGRGARHFSKRLFKQKSFSRPTAAAVDFSTSQDAIWAPFWVPLGQFFGHFWGPFVVPGTHAGALWVPWSPFRILGRRRGRITHKRTIPNGVILGSCLG